MSKSKPPVAKPAPKPPSDNVHDEKRVASKAMPIVRNRTHEGPRVPIWVVTALAAVLIAFVVIAWRMLR